MEAYIAKALRDMIEQIGGGDDPDVQIRNSYSGRGMYGRACPGITGSHKGCMEVIAEVIKEAHRDVVYDVGSGPDFERLVDALLNYSTDSMGLDIILYWPRLEAFPEPESGAVRDSYEDYACPDCGDEIPAGTVDGESCNNCGHVFYEQKADD
jgi:rubredoxin